MRIVVGAASHVGLNESSDKRDGDIIVGGAGIFKLSNARGRRFLQAGFCLLDDLLLIDCTLQTQDACDFTHWVVHRARGST